MTAPEPPPAVVESPFVGRLEFAGGFPTEATLQRRVRPAGLPAGLPGVPAPPAGRLDVDAFREGLRRDLGADHRPGLRRTSAWTPAGCSLTGNSETVYGTTFLDLKADGPTVLEVPPRVLGFLNDLWMRPLGDLGLAGPDAGAGRTLPRSCPPATHGELPAAGDDGYRGGACARGRTWCGSSCGPSWRRAATSPRRWPRCAQVRVYPWAQRAGPRRRCASSTPPGCPFDTIHPDRRALLRAPGGHDRVRARGRRRPGGRRPAWRSSGSSKGTPFAPDARLRGILEEAARVGSVMAFALCQRAPRRPPDVPGPAVVRPHPRLPGASATPAAGRWSTRMAQMAWFATGRAQAMGHPRPGTGSAYTWTYRDAAGAWLDPARTYRLRLPAPVPAKDFWSVVVYDLWTRSMLANGQPYPSVQLLRPGAPRQRRRGDRPLPRPRATGRVRGELDPHPARHRLVPHSCASTGPTEPWFDQTWTPGDLEPVDGCGAARSARLLRVVRRARRRGPAPVPEHRSPSPSPAGAASAGGAAPAP